MRDKSSIIDLGFILPGWLSLLIPFFPLAIISQSFAGPAIVTLGTFDGANGADPSGSLIADSAGNLFGTAYGGGASNDGTVFEIVKGSGTITALASFDGTNGANPYSNLIADANGNLYGTSSAGGANGHGTVFEVVNGSGAITNLASFDGGNGADPQSNLISDASGNLYGTAAYGGMHGYGTLFELNKLSGTLTALASFSGANGRYPFSTLVSDSAGNFFGTAYEGGASPGNGGTVFELASGASVITPLASFSGILGANGGNPTAGMIFDAAGSLYSTTSYGGAHTSGTLFKLAKGSNTVTTLASFTSAVGTYPNGGVIADAAGNLFGTAPDGGTAGGYGTVFEYAAGTGTLSALVSFDGSDGASPYAGLISDAAGNLYGTTPTGGTPDGIGSVFEITDTGFVVPEPTCASLFGAAGLLLLARRPRYNQI
jgi:uncharacterized repeat protein (TIGR03803 family)